MFNRLRKCLLAHLAVLVFSCAGAAIVHADTPPPPGANDWNCRSWIRPYPVVLVHGTLANMLDSWSFLAPLLHDLGYCVFTLNYGETELSAGLIYGLGPVDESAQELAVFVDKVLAATRASKVDIIGHSQGGMMPRHYIKFLGGHAKVNRLIGLAPSNHGSDLAGLLNLAAAIPLLDGLTQAILEGAPLEQVFPAAEDQLRDSEFLTTLNSGGETTWPVKYTVIASRYDELVTPYTSAFLSGQRVTNITVQDVCPLSVVEHVGMILDPVVFNLIVNALDPTNPDFILPSLYCGAGELVDDALLDGGLLPGLLGR